MNWLERAASIKASQEEADGKIERALKLRDIVANSQEALWESLVTHLQTNVEQFADGLPLAKEKELRARRLNKNNLTISTVAFPIIHMELIYHAQGGITGTLTESFRGLSKERVREIGRIWFTVDGAEPCLTDGERFLHPSQVADELMEKVADFFKTAMKLPSFL